MIFQPLTPISTSEHLPVIDALRGLAVMGILIMNVKHSSFPLVFANLWPLRLDGMVESITYWGLEFLVYGKFLTLFSLLFGVGMAVQMSRAIAKGSEKKFPLVYVRRLLVLLAIGFFHDIFIWRGAVLLWYPLMGFPLLLLRKLKPKVMLI